ncbi:MAG: hypothetical protein EXR60_05045 [Dehalococcoidia bacterium]|nr:hypothetical protein [Dehalococcoidia bacterium]
MQILNQFSLFIFGLAPVLLLAVVLLRHPSLPRIGAVLILLAVVATASIALRHRPEPPDSLANLQARLSDGQPTLVFFYSNY